MRTGCIALALLNCSLLVGYLATHRNFPGDFAAFYTAASIYRQHPNQLYDLNLQRQVEQQLVGRDDIPFYHPPYEVLAWLPLAGVSFQTAFWIWRAASLVFLALAAWVLAQTLCPRFSAASVFLIAMAFFPVPYCIWMGQDSVLLLAIFAACTWFLSKRKDFMAGIVLGLGLFKPELVLPIAAVFFLWQRWRFLSGLFVSGVAVSLVSFAMVGYSGMLQMTQMVVHGQSSQRMAIHPVMMPNLRGLIASGPATSAMTQTIVVLVLSAALLLVAAVTVRRDQPPARAFAMLICFAALVSFHLNLHDLALLLMPILVVLVP